MSIDATRWVWSLTRNQVTSTEKLILLAIADRCGEEGECWPSLSRLVRDTGYHRDAVIQNRKSLIEKKILVYTGEYKGRSKQIPIMKLMCDEWRKGDSKDDEFNQSCKTTARLNPFEPVVQNDTYQSSRTTQNLKEEPKRNNKISTSVEVSNLVYTEFVSENEKSDYKLNQLKEAKNGEIGLQVIETNSNSDKSDYCDNQFKNPTISTLNLPYGFKNIQEENIFNIPEQFIQDWITNRKKKRAPITQTAWNKINKELAKCQEQGIEPIEAFETMVASSWQSLKVEYFQTKELLTRQESEKKRSIELEQIALKRKQREIEDSRRIHGIISTASENERSKLRKMLGSRPPETIINHQRVS